MRQARRALGAWAAAGLASFGRGGSSDAGPGLDPEGRKRLRALGYAP